MKSRSLPVYLFFLFVLLLSAGCNSLSSSPGSAGELEPIQASGVIEAHQINIAPELPGRIKEIPVREGSAVAAGDLLFTLEDDQLLIQKTQAASQYQGALVAQASAQAALEAAQAFLASSEANLIVVQTQYKQILAQAQALQGEERTADWNQLTPSQVDLPAWYFQQPEKIQAAEQIVDLAWGDYQTELANFDKAVNEIEENGFLEAEQRLALAQAAYQIADTLRDSRVAYTGRQQLQEQIDLIYEGAEEELEEAQNAYDLILADPQYETILQARARVSVARERYDLALDYLAQQYSGVYSLDVLAADALVDQAQSALDQAQALVVQAEQGLASADVAVSQAEAALQLVDLQLEKTRITSPITGVVLSQAVEEGEMIGAGYTALTIGDLSRLTVTVYLPEDRYGQIGLGDQADLSIDSYPDKIFEAQVIYISDQAEYTPRNVQTQEERQNTVYAVKLTVTDPEGILIPGMPADVILNP